MKRQSKKRVKSMLFATLTGVTVATSLLPVAPVSAALNEKQMIEDADTIHELSSEDFDELINKLEQYLYVENGHFKFNVDEIPFQNFTQYGIENVYQFIEGIDTVNELADSGDVTIHEDKTVTDNTITARGGSTYSEAHWWGRRNYYSTTAAKNKITQVRNMAIAQGTAAGISGLFGFLPGAITGAIGSAWGNMLANSMENKNNQTNRGIIVDINWAAIYSVSIQ